MRFHKTLGTKFKEIQDSHTQIKKPAVSATLKAYLQNQSQRIDNLLMNKRLHSQKLERIATQSLNYRDSLKNKIQQSQQKHEKNRNAFLETRVKKQKFKIDEVERKRKELFEKIKQTKKQNLQTFQKTRSETVDFWKTKQFKTQKYYQTQTSVAPLHQDSVYRKKSIEKRNQMYAQEEKDKLLSKHSQFQQIINQALKKKQKVKEEYNQKLQKGYFKNQQILQARQNKFVNNICLHQDRSQALLKTTKKAYDKKMENLQLYKQDNIDRKKQNLLQKNMKRAQSMKQCKCHKKGSSPQIGLTQSITLNQQQGNFNKNSTPNKTKRVNWSVRQTRGNFLAKSQINLSNVKTNKQILQQKQDIQDQKKLMIQKQITNAVKTRQMIRNQSNNLIRQARVLG